ncbi:MAG: hypothetical protein ACNA7Q_12105 [Rhodobacterales bacterium]
MEHIKTYTINGTIYELRPLVFGQWQQLTRLVEGLDLPEVISARTMVTTLADRLDELLAIILTKQGKSPADKDIAALGQHLAFVMPPEQVAEVITDFFELTPTASLMELVVGVTAKLMNRITTPTGSSNASSSSVAATSPSATPSFGE